MNSSTVDTPDLLKELPIFNPVQFVQQALRGFCVPSDLDDSKRSNVRETSALKSDVPPSICVSSSSVSVDSIIADHEEDEADDAANETLVYDDLKEEDDLVVVETVPGTSRRVRVFKGVELFFYAVAVFGVTLFALKQAGADCGFQLHAKVAEQLLKR